MRRLIVILLACCWYNSGMAQDHLFDATIRCYYTFIQTNPGTGQPLRTDTMSLLIGNSQSKFHNPAKYQRDSLFASVLSNLNPSTIQSISVLKSENATDLSDYPGTTSSSNSNDGESYQILKNRTSGMITYLDYVGGGMMQNDSYQYEDQLNGSFNWKIDPETSDVLNYSCQKATVSFRGREYTAWFTSDIPVSDGPWKFIGLPGLILKVYDSEQRFSFELIGIENLQPPVPVSFDEAKFKCNRKQLADLKKKQGAGTQINIHGGNVVISEKPGKYEYNPLELN